jgi:hypothetical protein
MWSIHDTHKVLAWIYHVLWGNSTHQLERYMCGQYTSFDLDISCSGESIHQLGRSVRAFAKKIKNKLGLREQYDTTPSPFNRRQVTALDKQAAFFLPEDSREFL